MRWLRVIVLLAPLALAAQSKPEDTAAISGVVTNSVSGEPVRRAGVTLRRITISRTSGTIQAAQGAYTDAAGRFSLTGIAAGEYRLSAERSGFLTQGYGTKATGGSGALLTIEAGQKLNDVALRLTPHSVITGRIVDEDGEPVVSASVQILRQQYVNGKKQLTGANASNTNDLGEYRVFGLKPGRYYIGVLGRGNPLIQDADDDYVMTYFPRTTDSSAASPVEVTPGGQARNIDVTLRRVRTVAVRGRITVEVQPAPGSEAPLRLSVMLMPSSGSFTGGNARSATVAPQGTFDIRGVTPGAYTLTAIASGGTRAVSARLPVQVSSGNVEGLAVTIRGGVPLTGRVKIEGDAPADLKHIGIGLPAEETGLIQYGPLPAPKMMEDGSFRAEDVGSERYRVVVTGLPEGCYVKSIRSGEVDVLQNGLEVAGVPPAPVEVLLSSRAAQVTGVALDAKTQKPVPGAIVVLVPQDKTRTARADYYKNVTTDSAGRFAFKDLTPGEYRAYAWEDVEPGAWMDAEFLKPYEGEKVSLEESGRANVQLKVE
ncbi:MAG: carboxypeptidase regulatory-like domain-containing protein [Candidatus Solibacter sp.]